MIDVKEFSAIVRDVRLLLKFDANSDGVLDEAELLEALTSLGLVTDAEQVSDIMREFDTDGNGTIDLVELSALVRTVIAFVSPCLTQCLTQCLIQCLTQHASHSMPHTAHELL